MTESVEIQTEMFAKGAMGPEIKEKPVNPFSAAETRVWQAIQGRKASDAALTLCFDNWPDDSRRNSNIFARSSLFSATNGKDRPKIYGAISYYGNVEISYDGELLDQKDADVLIAIFQLLRGKKQEEEIKICYYSVLKIMGLTVGRENYKILGESLTRMKTGNVTVHSKNGNYSGKILNFDLKTGLNVVVNRDFIKMMFGDGEFSWSWINIDQRNKLSKKPLAKFLHAFYSTHKEPKAIEVSFMHKLSGSRDRSLASFAQKCKNALHQLVKIGFLESYDCKGGKIIVTRKN